jgi:hypothetical protein
MADENNNNESQNKSDQPNIEELVQQQLEEKLKDIKSKLDKAYEARDAAMQKAVELEQKQREENIKRLEAEGKEKEALEAKLEDINKRLLEEQAKSKTYEQRNVELSRDIAVKTVLATMPFRNEKAIAMAFSEITGQLIQNANGVWVHKSGSSIADFVKTFSEDESNSFLFKAAENNGAGLKPNSGSSSNDKNTSLFSKSQEEVLKLAREGKLAKRK